jgi:site-specific recombinase XerD
VDGKSELTIAQYYRTVSIFLRQVQKHFTEVDSYDIRWFLACEKNRGVSNRTLENTRIQLSAFFQWMVNDDLINKNPCSTVNAIKYTKKVRHPFSSVEIDALRSACKNSKERAILELLLSSGMRVSELTGLDVNDIDLDNMVIHIRHGKGDKERITYMSDVAKVYQLLADGGQYEGKRYLSLETCQFFLSRKSRISRRGLGFDKPDPVLGKGPCADEAPKAVVGHTGFTGTCAWVDPENNLVFVFISNRIYPRPFDHKALMTLNIRPRIQQLMYQALKM